MVAVGANRAGDVQGRDGAVRDTVGEDGPHPEIEGVVQG